MAVRVHRSMMLRPFPGVLLAHSRKNLPSSITSTLSRPTIRTITTGTSRSNNPYHILGVPPSSSFRTVQKAFVKLAFEHHPDTTSNDIAGNEGGGATCSSSSSSPRISVDFIRIRQAFERIRNAKQAGKSLNTTEVDEDDSVAANPTKYSWTETDFLNYFHRQTGVRLTSEQRQELVHLYRTRVQGAYYGGHSWDLARRLVAEQDAFLRNMESGCPSRSRRGSRHDQNASSFQTGSQESETSGANNLRRKRRR